MLIVSIHPICLFFGDYVAVTMVYNPYEEFLMNLHPNFEEQAEWIPDLFKKMPSIQMGGGGGGVAAPVSKEDVLN